MNLPGPDWLLAGYHKSGLEQASAPVLIGMNGQKHLQASLKDSIDSLIFCMGRDEKVSWPLTVELDQKRLNHSGRDGEPPSRDDSPGEKEMRIPFQPLPEFGARDSTSGSVSCKNEEITKYVLFSNSNCVSWGFKMDRRY